MLRHEYIVSAGYYIVDNLEFGLDEQAIAGCLDNVLSVFERLHHPSIPVGILAMQ
jgi:hypothetical protein